MKIQTKKYQELDRKVILGSLRQWLSQQENEYFFTTCYKSRAVGIFVQYEIPTHNEDPYLINSDQSRDNVLLFAGGWLDAILKKDVVFKIEEREKVGFSIYITSERVLTEDIEVSEDEIIDSIEQPETKENEGDFILKESEKRSLDEIAISTTIPAISRSMKEEVTNGDLIEIKRSEAVAPKVTAHTRQGQKVIKKKAGRKAEYNWDLLLPKLHKKHEGSIVKIAKELGCSAPAVRRQVSKFKKEGKL